MVPGIHRLTATGIDDSGNSYNSAPAVVGIATTLISSNSVWKYLDNGSDQGTVWREPAFDDSSWQTGPAQLGYGDGDEATVVSFGHPDDLAAVEHARLPFDGLRAPRATEKGAEG